jgi:hypothetical protein
MEENDPYYVEIMLKVNASEDCVETHISRNKIEDGINIARAFGYSLASCLEMCARPYSSVAHAISLYAAMNDCDPCFNEEEEKLCAAADEYIEYMEKLDKKHLRKEL